MKMRAIRYKISLKVISFGALEKINTERVRKLRDEALKFTAMRARGSFSTPSRKVMLLNDNDGLDAALCSFCHQFPVYSLCAQRAADEVRI
jgi:hypothetical protein